MPVVYLSATLDYLLFRLNSKDKHWSVHQVAFITVYFVISAGNRAIHLETFIEKSLSAQADQTITRVSTPVFHHLEVV